MPTHFWATESKGKTAIWERATRKVFRERNTQLNVDNGHCQQYTERMKRHKCSICGKVRFEKFLRKLRDITRYGNQCWGCVDNPDCLHKGDSWRSY